MAYQGFCDKYGVGVMMFTATLGLPLSLMTVFRLAQGGVPEGADISAAYLGGALGFLAGTVAHGWANSYLHRVRAGTTEGAAFVKKAQAGAYGAALLCAMAVNECLPPLPADADKAGPAPAVVPSRGDGAAISRQAVSPRP